MKPKNESIRIQKKETFCSLHVFLFMRGRFQETQFGTMTKVDDLHIHICSF